MIKNSTRHNRLVDGSPVPDVEGCNEVASPSSPQEMHLNRDRSGLFPLSTVWHAGHSMMVLRVFTTITGMPASVALYSMNDLSWWKDHELWMYLLPFLTVVLILMPSMFSRAMTEEVSLAVYRIFLDMTWLVFLANLPSFSESFFRWRFADLVPMDCSMERS